MALLVGPVSHSTSGSETHTQISTGAFGAVQGSSSTTHIASFRINSRQVEYRGRGVMPSFSDGDIVAASGSDKSGMLKARAVRNMTTGVVYSANAMFQIIGGIVVALISLPMILVLIGLLTLPLGIILLVMGLKTKSAIAEVNSAQMPSGSPPAMR